MKKVGFILFVLLLLTGCSNNGSENTAASDSSVQHTASQTTSSEQHTTVSEEKSVESTSVSQVTETSSQNNATTQETATPSDQYYQLIHEAWQKQKDYVDSITDDKVKQSVQTPFAAANGEASRLEMENAENPEAVEAIKAALEKVLNGQ